MPDIEWTHVASADQPSFEAALERLEEIVASLESEDLELAESLTLFEEGVRMLRLAEQQLGGAEGMLEQVLAEGEELSLRPLDAGP